MALSKIDLEALRDMLAQFGDLTKVDDGKSPSVYRNRSGHAGFDIPPGLADQPGKPLSPIALDEILRSRVWNDYIFRETDFSWQTSLMEPVGGMDNFVRSFARQPLARQSGTLDGLVRFGAKVTDIVVAGDKVTIAYEDQGSARTLAADFCVCSIPVPILQTLRTNLPPAFQQATRNLPVQAAGKVGWQAERFWETKDNIYGGISWTTDLITQIWYPSSGFLSPKGTLTGAYMYGDPADAFNARPLEERLRLAREQGERLHPDYAKYVEHGIAIGWNNMEFTRMGWADESDPKFGLNAGILATPQGRFHMAGDQITFWSGWQEGALISALEAVKSIDRQVNSAATRP
jgi:monoamine oxidase